MNSAYYGDFDSMVGRVMEQLREEFEPLAPPDNVVIKALRSCKNRHKRFYGRDNKYAEMRLP